jgi:two-component system C4-dicarboxylate transport response regulator DctD
VALNSSCAWLCFKIQPTYNDMTKLLALVIEDEDAVRQATVQTLELGGFEVRACASAEQATPWLQADFSGVVVTDVRLPGRSGLEVLAQVMALDADMPVILMTGHGHVSMAVKAVQDGAYDFIEKPFSAERLMRTALRAAEKRRLVLENRRLRAAWAANPDLPPLIGQSSAMERVRTLIATLGPMPIDVLINGETGTGKEVVARHLHAASLRKGPFVAINCGALPESVFESEIFGHEAGAFTGAQKRRLGKLEFAQHGTLFLDEIESMPLALQVKLLRVLQERRLERLGGNESVALDCRVVAASKVDLLAMSAKGQFREDLYFRLGAVCVDLPALNQRTEDIALLLAYFLQGSALRFNLPVPQWTQRQMQQWQDRPWQGNVRELRNFADRLVLGVLAGEQDCPIPLKAAQDTHILVDKLEVYECELITQALLHTHGNVAMASEQLGIPKKTLYDKLKKYQIKPTRIVS